VSGQKIKKVKKNKKNKGGGVVMADRIKKAFELFDAIAKNFELYPISEKSFPKLNEIRELSANYPIFFALVEETILGEQKLFKTIILTEEILLGYLSKEIPIIKIPRYRTILISLPVWVYLSENFLTNYTYRRGILRNGAIEKLVRYAETTPIPQGIKGKFINSIMELLAPYNTFSILETFEMIEKETSTTVIRIPDEVRAYFEKKYGKKDSE
jgi:hypothetical protein